MAEVHVYRNRPDDQRTPADMCFCVACNGWYGVPHTASHCQKGEALIWRPSDCACRFCCAVSGRPYTGTFGFTTTATEWQPPTPECVPEDQRARERREQYRDAR